MQRCLKKGRGSRIENTIIHVTRLRVGYLAIQIRKEAAKMQVIEQQTPPLSLRGVASAPVSFAFPSRPADHLYQPLLPSALAQLLKVELIVFHKHVKRGRR